MRRDNPLSTLEWRQIQNIKENRDCSLEEAKEIYLREDKLSKKHLPEISSYSFPPFRGRRKPKGSGFSGPNQRR